MDVSALLALPVERVGAGCEGVVTAVTVGDGRRLRVKRFRRRSELERSLVGVALLRWCLRGQGWEGHLILPRLVALDLDQRVVVTEPFVDPPGGPLPPELVRTRVRAVAAVHCAAGLAAALPAATVREIVTVEYGEVSSALVRCWFEGVALNQTSLVTDGRHWFLVDF